MSKDKQILLLPPVQLLPAEWETVEKLLKDHAYEDGLKAVYFIDGFVQIETLVFESYNPNWHEHDQPEYETVNIRDLDVDHSKVRGYLESMDNAKEYSDDVKSFVSDAIIELTQLFTDAAIEY